MRKRRISNTSYVQSSIRRTTGASEYSTVPRILSYMGIPIGAGFSEVCDYTIVRQDLYGTVLILNE